MPYTLPPDTALGSATGPGAIGGIDGLGGTDSPGSIQNPITGRFVPVVRRYRPTATGYNALREPIIDWEVAGVQILEGTIRPVVKNATPIAHYLPEGMSATTRQFVISLGLLTTSWSDEPTDVLIGDRIDDIDPFQNPVHYRVFDVQTPFRSSVYVWLQLMDPDGD